MDGSNSNTFNGNGNGNNIINISNNNNNNGISNKKTNPNLKSTVSTIENARSKTTAVNDLQAKGHFNSSGYKPKPPNKGYQNADRKPKPRGNVGKLAQRETTAAHSDVQAIVSSGSPRLIDGKDTLNSIPVAIVRNIGKIDNKFNTSGTAGAAGAAGFKKQNLNHLLNFHYAPREVDGNSSLKRNMNAKPPKFNKEQFLQANCQFVIKSSAKKKAYKSADVLIDWSLIEQINIRTSDEMQCPICLYPPKAAKMTRCGHIYCWPCILHYLSMTDKSWSKCPICFEAVHAADLKSAAIIQQEMLDMGSLITFHLMRRKKGLLYIEKHDRMQNESVVKCPFVSSSEEEKCFAKFLLAKRIDVSHILEREERELLAALKEGSGEYMYIQEALQMLMKRKLSESQNENNSNGRDIEAEANAADNQKPTAEVFRFDSDETSIQPVMNEMDGQQEASATPIDHLDDTAANVLQTFEETVPQVNESIPDNLDGKTMQDDDDDDGNCTVDEENDSDITGNKTSNKFYYFYQCIDGQNIYLHPINVKMLLACYGSLAKAPKEISARIVQKEQYNMNSERRRKYRCLNHLPLTCEVIFVEVELLPPYVTEDIIRSFKEELAFRRKVRRRRARAELERERKISEINDQQMGKIVANTMNIDLNCDSDFPVFGNEQSLPEYKASVTPEPSMEQQEAPTKDETETATTSGASLENPKEKQRNKTPSVSGSSVVTGAFTYSDIVVKCREEATPWVTINACELERQRLLAAEAKSKPAVAEEPDIYLANTPANLGDVIAAALSQTTAKISKTDNNKAVAAAAHAAAAAANEKPNTSKKSKKPKRMQLIYSSGINFTAK